MPRSQARGGLCAVDLVVQIVGQRVERRDSRGHRERIPRQRSRLIDGPVRRDLPHEIATSAVGRDRESPADDFAERREIGGDAESLARAAERDAKSRHHLVEDEQRAVRVGERAQPGKKRRVRRDEPGVSDHRLDDDRRDRVSRAATLRPRRDR